MKILKGGVCAPLGFKASGVHCGIRKNKTKEDLALVVSDVMCSAAAVYTTNKVKGAPILVTKKHLENGKARAIICNSGNANTCNADGVEKAERMCALASEYTGIAHHPKHLGHPLLGQVQVGLGIFGHHVHGGLPGGYGELPGGLQAAADIF